MRILVIGRSESTVELSTLFPSRPDFRIGKFADVSSAAAVIDGTEPALALFHVDGDDFSGLDELHLLASRGVQTLVLAGTLSPALRASAFDAGAADVLFPPVTSKRAEAAVLSLLGRPARRETRFAAAVPAILGVHAPGAPTFAGSIVDLSRGGFRARLPATLPTGTVVRVAISPPPPHRIPVLFSIILAAEPDETAGWSTVRARFVGITDDERALLTGFVETLEPEVIAPPVALDAVLAMDAAAISDADLGTVAGMRLPAFTAAERSASSASALPKDRALAGVALARARVTMLFDLIHRNPELAPIAAEKIALPALRAEIRVAVDDVRAALGRAVASGSDATTRDLTDLQARTAVASDLVERLASHLTGEAVSSTSRVGLQENPDSRTFASRRKAEAPPAPASPSKAPPNLALRGAAALFLLGTFAVLAVLTWLAADARRARDPALDSVTPRPAMVSGAVRVRSIFTDGRGERIAVIDGSWFRATLKERETAAREIAAKSGRVTLTLRDYRARPLAVVSSSGTLTLYPVPAATR